MRLRTKFGLLLLLILATTAYLVAATLVANAGPDQSGMFVGDTVQLNGEGSEGETSYSWSFTKKPSGSTAVIVNPTLVNPTFVPDRGGLYTVKLVVGNGATTKSDTVNITTGNREPVANAGPDASQTVGKNVTLDGTLSTDPDLNKLTYLWTVVSQPEASVTKFAKPTVAKPSLFLDRPGTYVMQLVVGDGLLTSAPDQVTVTTTNSAPKGAAGPDRQIVVGAAVQLDATGSSDIDGDALTYQWTLTRPGGSLAALNDPTSPLPSFTPDKAGNYTATVSVSDGTLVGKDAVVLTTIANRAPIAHAGVDDVPLVAGTEIQLDGSHSTDTNGQPLTYTWTVTNQPATSVATLVGPATPRPTFTADVTGKYTFSLQASDGLLTNTDPQAFSIARPRADAGPDQVVSIGATVTLDGSASSHLNGTLAYGWALISVPAGSMAELNNPTDPQPHFVADLEGMYIAQLIAFDGTRLSPADTVAVTTNANLPPRVVLGADRLVTTGVFQTIDALATDPNLDPLTFAWSLLSKPAGSAAVLTPSTLTAQITPDVAGDYVVQLIATDLGGLASVGTLLLTTGNTNQVADVGPDRIGTIGAPVPLSVAVASGDADAVTHAWRMLKKPIGSTTDLDNPSAAEPSFTPDSNGVYVVQVVVRDPLNVPALDAVVVRIGEAGTPPIADAGDPQTVPTGSNAQLDGTGSSDPEGQPLTYAWEIVTKPAGSNALLSDATSATPTVLIDVSGEYVIELVVNDGSQNSAPSQVTITGNAPPTADAGNDQSDVDVNVAVQIDGSGSSDPESQPLTYSWSFVSKPGGSAAALSSTTASSPTFTPDLAGTYILQLVVNDGLLDSIADTVTITTRQQVSLSPNRLTLQNGGVATLTVSVGYPSAMPLVVQLASSNTGVAAGHCDRGWRNSGSRGGCRRADCRVGRGCERLVGDAEQLEHRDRPGQRRCRRHRSIGRDLHHHDRRRDRGDFIAAVTRDAQCVRVVDRRRSGGVRRSGQPLGRHRRSGIGDRQRAVYVDRRNHQSRRRCRRASGPDDDVPEQRDGAGAGQLVTDQSRDLRDGPGQRAGAAGPDGVGGQCIRWAVDDR
jgi:hypothetical protein